MTSPYPLLTGPDETTPPVLIGAVGPETTLVSVAPLTGAEDSLELTAPLTLVVGADAVLTVPDPLEATLVAI